MGIMNYFVEYLGLPATFHLFSNRASNYIWASAAFRKGTVPQNEEYLLESAETLLKEQSNMIYDIQ